MFPIEILQGRRVNIAEIVHLRIEARLQTVQRASKFVEQCWSEISHIRPWLSREMLIEFVHLTGLMMDVVRQIGRERAQLVLM